MQTIITKMTFKAEFGNVYDKGCIEVSESGY